MSNLEKRIATLEKKAAYVDLRSLSDDELMARIERFGTLSEAYGAIISQVGRRKSAFPVVRDVRDLPDYENEMEENPPSKADS